MKTMNLNYKELIDLICKCKHQNQKKPNFILVGSGFGLKSELKTFDFFCPKCKMFVRITYRQGWKK